MAFSTYTTHNYIICKQICMIVFVYIIGFREKYHISLIIYLSEMALNIFELGRRNLSQKQGP